ncbi:MAG TPA: VWA domain-containing protein [Thermoplasmata archaeon]|nr:VWA domain-containing protein [Thermoplasmata archaeon]
MNASPPSVPDLANRFVDRVAGFVVFLRRRGLAVGVGAELDLGRALESLATADPASFREACHATLAKSPAEVALVDDALDAYWSSLEGEPAAAPSRDAPPAPRNPPADGRLTDRSTTVSLGRGFESPRPLLVGLYSDDAPSPGHPLTLMDPAGILTLRSGARRFRRAVATLAGRRTERSRRGRIDFPATSRASLRNGGEWVVFRRQRRKRLRADLLILWDVSGSMREHDSDLFALVYALHRSCPRSRVFAFSTDLHEITPGLRGRGYPRAAAAVLPTLGAAGGGTRIGACLGEFVQRYGLLVRSETAVVILSDGWDRDDLGRLGLELRAIRRRAHRVVWVNPHAATEGFEPRTAGMMAALPHIDFLLAPDDFRSRGPLHDRS